MNEIIDDCKWFADKHRGKNKQSGPHWSTIIRFLKLYDEAVRLENRVQTLEAYIADFCSKRQEYCDWNLEDLDNNYFDGKCGVTFRLEDGTPEKNGFNYCPGFGKRLRFIEGE